MEALKRLYGQLRLRINEAKSAVARPQDHTFLGYSFGYAKGGAVKRRVAPQGSWGDEGASPQDYDPKRWTEHAVCLC